MTNFHFCLTSLTTKLSKGKAIIQKYKVHAPKSGSKIQHLNSTKWNLHKATIIIATLIITLKTVQVSHLAVIDYLDRIHIAILLKVLSQISFCGVQT